MAELAKLLLSELEPDETAEAHFSHVGNGIRR